MQDDLDPWRWLEGGRWISLGTHHKLGKGVATVSFVVHLQKSQGLILDLRPAIALNELKLHFTLLICKDQALHGCAGVVLCGSCNFCGPHAALLIEVLGHEQVNVLVTETNLDHLLQAAIEPHEAATVSTDIAIHLKLELIEATIALLVDLLFKIDAIRPVHLVQHLLHRGTALLWIHWVVQVGGAFATTSVDALNQTLLVNLHSGDGTHEVCDDFLFHFRISEVRLEVLTSQNLERRCWCTDLLTDLLETDLLEIVGGFWLSAWPDQAHLGYSHRCLR
mmetsp:Transcript_11481/g.20634  ORF Transcript_11481/g.20634 Transcript_11481/m.20634 type:complete len:279 (-) Transcript_11481:531-1367(-)